MAHDAHLILPVGAVLAAGVAAAGLATRLRAPALVLFAALDAVGSDGLGWIAFDDYRLARLIGTVALVLILFEGGLPAGWRELRPVLGPAVSLAVIGTVLTAVIVGLAAAACSSSRCSRACCWARSSPPPTARRCSHCCVESGCRCGCAGPSRGVGPERPDRRAAGPGGHRPDHRAALRGGDRDPVPRARAPIGVAVGAAGGLLVARGARLAHRLPNGLVHVGSLAAAALAYGTAGALGGSGSCRLSARPRARRRSAGRPRTDHRVSTAAWPCSPRSACSLRSACSCSRASSRPMAIKAVLLALITALLARPFASTLATARQGFSRSERTLLAWADCVERCRYPRTFAVIEGVPRGIELLNIVFFAVLVSAALQGPIVHALGARISADRADRRGLPSRARTSTSASPVDRATDASTARRASSLDRRDVCLEVVGDGKDWR